MLACTLEVVGNRPAFCDVTPEPELTSVPLPAALLMLLTGFGVLCLFRRKDPKQKLREAIARHAQSDQPHSQVGGIEIPEINSRSR